MADTGHVRKRGKTWTFVYSVPDPITGKRKQIWRGGYPTKQQARQALRAELAAIDKGIWVSPSKTTLQEFVTETWMPLINSQLEESTVESYQRNMNLHVLPVLGHIRLQNLGAHQLNALYQQLLARASNQPKTQSRRPPGFYRRITDLRSDGKSYQAIADTIQREYPTEATISRHAVARIIARSNPATSPQNNVLGVTTIRYIHTIISRCLQDAVKLDLLAKNVATQASPPPALKAKPEKQLWTADQTKSFFHWCQTQNKRLFPAWAFVASSADRRGGNLGFRWQDIDLTTGLAKLKWTVTCVKHQIVVKPYGKSGKENHIFLDPIILDILAEWRTQQAAERSAFTNTHTCDIENINCNKPGYHNKDLVFTTPNGNYLHPERFTRQFQRAQTQYNRRNPDSPLPKINLHALRHGWATTALEAGIPMKVVQDRLNHASQRITADIYTKVRPPIQSDAANQVSALILPQPNETAAPKPDTETG